MKLAMLGALLAATALLAGCDEKKETATDDKTENTKGEAVDDDEKAEGELPAACQAWKKCIDGMEDAVKQSNSKAFEAWEKSYRAAPAETKAALETSCKTTVDALRQAGQCK